MSQWQLDWPSAGQFGVPRKSGFTDERWSAWAGSYSSGGWPADDWDADKGASPSPATCEPDGLGAPPEDRAPWPRAPYPDVIKDSDPGAEEWTDRNGGRGRRGSQGRDGRRWLIPAGAAVAVAAVGAVTTLLTSGHAAGGFGAPPATPGKVSTTPPSSATAAGPLTVTQAQSVLATYTQVNNGANAQRSDELLATVETGSSYAIDTGLYQTRQAAGVAPYPGFRPAQATYFIPRDEPVTGPRWFAVQVANAFLSNPRSVTSTEYLLFTQAVPGGPWRNAIEPYILPDASTARIAIGADGLATAVSPGAASVAVAPSQLPAATAASLDGTGQAAVANLGNLADRSDQRLWQAAVPGGKVIDAHAPATGADGQEFALLTVGGGALVFYSDAAELTITPPAGSMLHLTVPGLYSSAQAQTQDRVSYLEQFAAYDPPVGDGAPRVVASYSAITGRN